MIATRLFDATVSSALVIFAMFLLLRDGKSGPGGPIYGALRAAGARCRSPERGSPHTAPKGVEHDCSHGCFREAGRPCRRRPVERRTGGPAHRHRRESEQASRFAARGVRVRRGDDSVPETLGPAVDDVERLLLISGLDIGRRVEQHRAVIDAARAAGVRLIAYTSLLKADSSTLPMAGEHAATEALLRGVGAAVCAAPQRLLHRELHRSSRHLARARCAARVGAARASRRSIANGLRGCGRRGRHDRWTRRKDVRACRRSCLHDAGARRSRLDLGRPKHSLPGCPRLGAPERARASWPPGGDGRLSGYDRRGDLRAATSTPRVTIFTR